MLRQELTIAYQHRQQGNSGYGTVPFSYPNIIDRPIGCHDKTAIEDTARCGFPTPKLSIPSEDVTITRFFGKGHCGVLISGMGVVLDAPGFRNRVFLGKNLVVTCRFGKKPGFLGRCASWTGVISTRLDVTIARFFGKGYAVVS